MNHVAAHILPRLRVFEALEQAVADYRLVVLVTPSGYGKSTAASELAAHAAARVLYVRFSEEVHSPEHLWSIVCARLREQGADGADRLKRLGFPSDSGRRDAILELCGQCVSHRPTLLILDDYHFIKVPEADAFLERLAREEINGLSILVMSRTRPAIALEELCVKGLAVVFGRDLLAFSKTETRSLFNLFGQSDTAIADAAWKDSEGWAAALRVALQGCLTGRGSGGDLDMDKLISEIFYSFYAPEDQRLLIQLSLLEYFTPEDAVALCGDRRAPSRLRVLHECNAFISYSAETDTYLMHSLLQNFLNALLQDDAVVDAMGIDREALFRRAGEISVRKGNTLQAMRFFARAGTHEDCLRILDLFASPDEGHFISFDPQGVKAIMESVPWEARCLRPVEYLGFIQRYMVRVDRGEGVRMLREAEKQFSWCRSMPPELRARVEAETYVLRATARFNDIGMMCECCKKACVLLHGRSRMVNKDMFWTFGCPHSAFLYLRKPGAYRQLLKLIDGNLDFYQKLSGGACAGAQDLLLAEYLLETGAIPDVRFPLTKALFKAEEKRQSMALVAAGFTRIRFFLAQREEQSAWQELERMAARIRKTANPVALFALDLARGYTAAVTGRAEDAPAWLLSGEMPSMHSFEQSVVFAYVVRGKLLVAQKRWGSLEALAEEAEEQMRPLNNLFGKLHVLLFRTIASGNSHHAGRTLDYLRQALELARPDGILLSIAEYGRHIHPMQRHLQELHPEDAFLAILGKYLKRYVKYGHEDDLNLTVREREILERAASGSSNQAIGTALGLTQGSVANTLSRIYAKLGVKNRVEAVHKWMSEAAEAPGHPPTNTGPEGESAERAGSMR